MEEIKVDATSGTVSLKIDGTYTAAQLREVLQAIGYARAQIAQEPAEPVPGTTQVEIPVDWAFSTKWGGNHGHNFLFALRHQGYGWIGISLPPNIAAQLSQLLGQYMQFVIPQLTARSAPATTSQVIPESGGGGTLH